MIYRIIRNLIPLRRVHFTEAAQREIDHMLSLGIIENSESEYSSPLLCIPKKDGNIRLVLDARNLNKILVNDRESSPHIDELLLQIQNQKSFQHGRHELPILADCHTS